MTDRRTPHPPAYLQPMVELYGDPEWSGWFAVRNVCDDEVGNTAGRTHPVGVSYSEPDHVEQGSDEPESTVHVTYRGD